MPQLTLTTTIEPTGPAGAIILTETQAAELSNAKTPAVIVTIGERSVQGRVGRMGGRIMIGLSKAARAALAVELGDEVTATIALDEAERKVEIPPLLQAALDGDATLAAAFAAQSYSTRKEMARQIAEAKRPETADRRLHTIMDTLLGTK